MTAKEEAEKYFSDATECYKNNDAERAKEYFTKVIQSSTRGLESRKNDKVLFRIRGIAHFYIKDYQKAINDFSTAMILGERDSSIYRIRGTAYLNIYDYVNGRKDLTTAIKMGETDEFVYGNRGIANLSIKHYSEAIEDFRQVIELDEYNKNAYGNRGLVYLRIKDFAKAMEDFTKVIKLNKIGNEKNKNTDDRDYTQDTISLTDNVYDLVIDILQRNELKFLPDDETINLIELVCYCYDLMDEIKIEPSEVEGEQLVHYTKAGTLRYLLKKDHSAKLRLNNAVYMNDPEEGQILKRVLCQLDQNNELEKLFKDEDVKNYTYLTCFCPYDKRDELPMWIHYGDGGKGVGLVFNNHFFNKADLYKVQYIDAKKADIRELNKNIQKKITAIFVFLKRDEIKNNNHKEFKEYVNIILNYVSYLFKDKAYEYENEVRILKYRDDDSQDIKTDGEGRDIPRLFIEYDKCISKENCVEVIAGPKAQYTEIAAYAKYVGIQKVSQSEIKYR